MNDRSDDELGPLAGLAGIWEGVDGTAEPGARAFRLSAEVGFWTDGICSNRFLDREFETVRYEPDFELRDANTIHYREDTVLQVRGQDALFHHTDESTLKRVAS